MRELTEAETEIVSGSGSSGFVGAGAILAVLSTGAAISLAPLSAVVIGIGLGAAGGLAIAQFLANLSSIERY